MCCVGQETTVHTYHAQIISHELCISHTHTHTHAHTHTHTHTNIDPSYAHTCTYLSMPIVRAVSAKKRPSKRIRLLITRRAATTAASRAARAWVPFALKADMSSCPGASV